MKRKWKDTDSLAELYRRFGLEISEQEIKDILYNAKYGRFHRLQESFLKITQKYFLYEHPDYRKWSDEVREIVNREMNPAWERI